MSSGDAFDTEGEARVFCALRLSAALSRRISEKSINRDVSPMTQMVDA